MPRGKLHYESFVDDDNFVETWEDPHGYKHMQITPIEDDDDGEELSVYDAALIWASNGKDEDYMFGYSEDELEDAL